jgi:hypothetical protein
LTDRLGFLCQYRSHYGVVHTQLQGLSDPFEGPDTTAQFQDTGDGVTNPLKGLPVVTPSGGGVQVYQVYPTRSGIDKLLGNGHRIVVIDGGIVV